VRVRGRDSWRTEATDDRLRCSGANALILTGKLVKYR
jgi:hypothetical protein